MNLKEKFFDIFNMYVEKKSHQKKISKTLKKLYKKLKLKQLIFFITTPGKHSNKLSIPIKFPVFIKQVTGGDSRGIDLNSIAHDFESFTAKVLDIKIKQNSPSLVETYLSGKEYSDWYFRRQH